MSDDLVERVAREICCPPHLGHCCPEECSVHHFLPTARAAIAVVLQEAAKVAEAFPARTHGNLASAPYAAAEQAGDEIAAAIRALKESK